MDSFGPSTSKKVSEEVLRCRQQTQIESKAVVKLNRLSAKEIQKYDNDFYEEFVKVESEPNNEDITQSEFMRYNGLISTKELTTNSIEVLKQSFPVRKVSRIGRQLTDDSNRVVLDRNMIFKQNFRQVIKRKAKPLNIKRKPKLLSKQEIEKQNQIQKTIEKRRQMATKSNEKKKIGNFLNSWEFSTELFQRLNRTFGCHQLSPKDAQKLLKKPIKLEVYQKNKVLLNSDQLVKYNNWNASDIERKSNKSELHFKVKGQPFTYAFTRRQRLDKYKRLVTGLNWESRLKQLNCKQVSVRMPLICLICCQRITETHVCQQKAQQLTLSAVEDNTENIDNKNDEKTTKSDDETKEKNPLDDNNQLVTDSKQMSENKKKPLDIIDVNFKISHKQ